MPLMKHLLMVSLFCALGLLPAAERMATPALEVAPLDAEHQLLQTVLSRVVDFPAGVDYAALYRDHGDLDAYRAQLAQATLPSERAAQLAFWINAYNATTLALVVHHLPKPGADADNPWPDFSVMHSVEGFWQGYAFEVAGEWLTIDAMQKQKLAALGEPRIHFAINCASVSCPPLSAQVYTAENLDAQLSRAVRHFVADEQQVQITATGWTGSGRLATLNPIMQWYRQDFGGSDDSVREFLANHAADETRAANLRKAKLAYAEYDWGLNRSASIADQ